MEFAISRTFFCPCTEKCAFDGQCKCPSIGEFILDGHFEESGVLENGKRRN